MRHYRHRPRYGYASRILTPEYMHPRPRTVQLYGSLRDRSYGSSDDLLVLQFCIFLLFLYFIYLILIQRIESLLVLVLLSTLVLYTLPMTKDTTGPISFDFMAFLFFCGMVFFLFSYYREEQKKRAERKRRARESEVKKKENQGQPNGL